MNLKVISCEQRGADVCCTVELLVAGEAQIMAARYLPNGQFADSKIITARFNGRTQTFTVSFDRELDDCTWRLFIISGFTPLTEVNDFP